MDIKKLIPQRSPIMMVDELLCVNGDEAKCQLTIRNDNYFIDECWRHEFKNDFLISGETLLGTLAHEIAHLYVWRHGKKHAALTEKLLQQIQAA